MNPPSAELRRQPNPPVILPDELITEILSFVTAKSLIRLRCMSKSWNSLISSPTFIQKHLHNSVRNPHLTLFSTKSKNDANYSVVPFSVRRLLENQSITLPDDPYYQLKDKDCRWVVGSCNGLLCLLGYSFTNDYREIWFCFWNPATNKKSEKLGFFRDYVMGLYTLFKFAFGYDDSTGTYKVVALLRDGQNRPATEVRARVFSLRDNVWRDIQSFPAVPLQHVFPFHYTHPGVNDGVYLSGRINWLALDNNRWKNVAVEEFVIISLDLGTETFTQLMPPRGFDELAPVEPTISVLMDCLCFCHDFKRTDFVIWQMKEFGVEQSWTRLLKISYQSLRSIQCDFVDLEYSQWLPLHLSKNGDTLILANNQEKQAIFYNLRDKRVERTRIADEIHWFSVKNYVESLALTF